MARKSRPRKTTRSADAQRPRITMRCPTCAWTLPASWLHRVLAERPALPQLRAYHQTHDERGRFRYDEIHHGRDLLGATLRGYIARITLRMIDWINLHGLDADGRVILVQIVRAGDLSGRRARLSAAAPIQLDATIPVVASAPIHLEDA